MLGCNKGIIIAVLLGIIAFFFPNPVSYCLVFIPFLLSAVSTNNLIFKGIITPDYTIISTGPVACVTGLFRQNIYIHSSFVNSKYKEVLLEHERGHCISFANLDRVTFGFIAAGVIVLLSHTNVLYLITSIPILIGLNIVLITLLELIADGNVSDKKTLEQLIDTRFKKIFVNKIRLAVLRGKRLSHT